MKLKKLLASCVLIAAMGITLTGCDLDIKGIVDEINSVVNDESSRDTEHESSSDKDSGSSKDKDSGNSRDTNTESSSDSENSADTNTEEPKTGTWVQTEMKYYAYKNGEEPYCSEQDECYKYRCYYRGVTDDNFVKFQTSGGFHSSKMPSHNSHIDAYHLCSVPENSYPAGGLVTLQVRTYWENYEGDWYPNGGAWIGIAYEKKEEDTVLTYRNSDPFLHNISIGFYSALNDDYSRYVYENTSDTLTANMPEEAENGNRIAIVFQPDTATGYGGEYEVGSWVEWIYTYTENP